MAAKPKRVKPIPRPDECSNATFFLLMRDEKEYHAEEIQIDGALYALFKALAQPDKPREAALIAFVKDQGQPAGTIIKTLTRTQFRAACDLTMKMDKLCPAA